MTANQAERLDLMPDAVSVKDARSFVVKVLTAWGKEDLLDAAALITSELATNVVEHVGTPYAIVLRSTKGVVLLDVLDGGNHAPALRNSGSDELRGRGLALVASLADSWGETPPDERSGFAKGVRAVFA